MCRIPAFQRRYARRPARTSRSNAAICPAWCFRRQTESRGRSNRRNPRRHAAVSTAHQADPASRRARRMPPAPQGCRSRHAVRKPHLRQRQSILPSKCIQRQQPSDLLTRTIANHAKRAARGASNRHADSRTQRTAHSARNYSAITRRERP